jgi:hypothetical protein
VAAVESAARVTGRLRLIPVGWKRSVGTEVVGRFVVLSDEAPRYQLTQFWFSTVTIV